MTSTKTNTGLESTVSVAIASLPDSPEPSKHKPGIKELLAQLQDAIASSSNLDEEDKEKALSQLKNLAEVARKTGDGSKTSIGVGNKTITTGKRESIEKLYSIKEPQAVYNFLESYPFMVPLLQEAHGHIRKHFPNARLLLKYITYPEIYNPQLAVYIPIDETFDAEKAVDLLERIEDDWWLDAGPRSQGKMIIGFD